MIHLFIQDLKISLQKPLPGKHSQFKMSPQGVRGFPVNAKSVNAAVLVLIFPENNEPSIVFMKRLDYEGHHGGQVSLPGGKYDWSDLSLQQTALREANEELGIDSNSIEIIGVLSKLKIPVSGFTVYPYIGFIKEKPHWNPNPNEVSYLIEAPISLLTNPLSVKSEMRDLHRSILNVPFYEINNEKIWGATAMIISEFIDLL